MFLQKQGLKEFILNNYFRIHISPRIPFHKGNFHRHAALTGDPLPLIQIAF